MKEIERSSCGPFVYTRFEYDSNVLRKPVRYGTLRLVPDHYVAPREPRATIYLFHGGNGDDRQAVDIQLPTLLGPELTARLKHLNAQIVLPYIGTSFLHGSCSDQFFNELMPRAEEDHPTEASCRYLVGFSMGGQAALNAFFRKPSLFAGVGANFPTLIGFDYSDESQAKAYAERTRVDEKSLDVLVGGFKSEFADVSDFKTHDPVSLVRQAAPGDLNDKRICFDVGTKDLFGLFEGASLLSEELRERSIEHRFELIQDGQHDGAFLFERFPKALSYLLA